MMGNKKWRAAVHLLLVFVLAISGVMWGERQASATGTQWRDITANATLGSSGIYAGADGKLYLLNELEKKIFVRGASDSQWEKLVDLPGNQFTSPYKLAIRNGVFYIIDRGSIGNSPYVSSKIMKSDDNGATWTEVAGPSGGYSAVQNGAYLMSIFFDGSGNLYVVDYFAIFKLDTQGVWTKILPFPEDASYTYRFSSAAADGSDQLYATMMKINKMMPTMGQTAALYSYNGTVWTLLSSPPLPASNMELRSFADGTMLLAQGPYNFMLTPASNIYSFNGSSLSMEATTNNFQWTSGGVAFDGSYYYILDYSQGIVRTDNPIFGNAKASPTLVADTSDNDTDHAIELTFADDEDWREEITEVTVTRNGAIVAAPFLVDVGTITLTGLSSPGSYQIKVKATGYTDATVVQQVNLVPSVWYDITDNLALATPTLSYDNDKIYAFSMGSSAVYYRSESDSSWSSVELPQGQFGVAYSFAARDDKWYVADLYMNTNPMTTEYKIHISEDEGLTWSPYVMPSNFTPAGALNPIVVDAAGTAYIHDGKKIFILDANRQWSSISVLPNAGSYSYAMSGIAIDGAQGLYANIRQYNPGLPFDNAAKLYKYNAGTSQWDIVVDSPGAMMQLYGDAEGNVHAGMFTTLNGETPNTSLYRIQGNEFVPSATLDSFGQARFGMINGGGYYYTVEQDLNAGATIATIRTTNPNYPYIPTYKVLYQANGGTGTAPKDGQAYELGQTATVVGSGALAKSGYTFAGWNTEADGSGESYAENDTITIDQAANVTLYAQWAAKNYIVEFDADGGTVNPTMQSKRFDAPYGKGADGSTDEALPTPEREGYGFAGWYTQASGAGTQVTDTTIVSMTEAHVLFAKWLAGVYTVTFDADGGTVSPATQSKLHNAAYGVGADGSTTEALPTPEREGYAFAGWYTQADGAGTQVTDLTEVTATSNHTLYAKWIANVYSVAFESNGGSAVDAIQADFDTTLDAPAEPAHAGYRFAGWYKEEGLANAWDFASDKVPLNGTTLYAKWTKLYAITYDGNGHTGGNPPAAGAYAAGETAILPGNSGEMTHGGLRFAGWNTKADGSGDSYQAGAAFVIVEGDVTLFAKWTTPPSSGSGGGTPAAPSSDTSDAIVQVNGKSETAGKAVTTEANGQRTTTVQVDEAKLEQRLATAGDRAILTILVNSGVDHVVGELNGRMVKNMENRQAFVQIRTDKATYTLPAKEIDIDAISELIGKQVALQDIKIAIEVGKPSDQTVEAAKKAAADNGLEIVVLPLDFTVKATYGGKTIDVTKFNAYVERTMAIPTGVDPNRITTGIVVEADGSVRHVPTKVVRQDGVYYAQINSLTNSAYAVVWHPVAFADMASHWAKDEVNDLGSRLVAKGLEDGLFHPEQKMTRAEFAAALVRALGLRAEKGKAPFSDIRTSDWYNGEIATAAAYGLIGGFADGSFRPNATLTREQAMKMLAGAMELTGLQSKLSGTAAEQRLFVFEDADRLSPWARSSAALALEAGIVNGRGNRLAAKENMTRAEVMVMIRRLLKASDLI
ncbi:InlB B-repeat-containing protein [Cohnella phaseoli]|uniref:Putative repeat protein (TIGR02543 family) n=1 Tax=Cohnella phaseoli TaxID=456490 RepID=A0A3D9JNW7_9BACL|nr:InlB B-repeat-containing protein [Cohnella phaseoli]RED75742.1 putative repeat protein (TIGR02543 family) [Cohnella phaseoli]